MSELGSTDNLIGTADVLGVELEQGEYRLKLGRAADGEGIAGAVAAWGLTGVVAIPDPPTDGDACMAMFVREGDELVAFATRDNRYAAKIGSLAAGTRGFVTRGAVRMLLNPEKEAWTAYTENSEGKARMIDLRGSDDTITIVGNGCMQVMGDHEITWIIDGGATMRLGRDGLFVTGPYCSLACSQGALGQLGPGIAPIVGANSIVMGPTGLAGVGSTGWLVAPAPA